MSSSLFSIARTALVTQQRVLETVSQNIANAETPGYSRQEAVLTANDPVRMPFGMVGTGVQVSALNRKRDTLLDNTYRTQAGTAGEATMRRDSLSSVQDVFGEPSDAGMSDALDKFWNAWSDLASTPSSQANKAVVQQTGSQVASLFNQYDQQLTTQRNSQLDRLNTTIATINQTATQVADLNGKIAASEVGGEQANDLRDQRDMMLDKLATMAGTRVIPQANGSISVVIGNSTLVDGTTARALTVQQTAPNPPANPPSPDIPISIRLGDSPNKLQNFGGEIQAIGDSLNTSIPGLRNRLNTMAASLVSTVNTIHTSGYTFTNNSGTGTAAGNFFDPGSSRAPVTAGSIKIDAAIQGNVDLIAVSGAPNAPLDNSAATQLTALRNKTATVTYQDGGTTETGSFLGFFRSMVTTLGLQVSNATDDATVSTTLQTQADTKRQSVSGVNSDEELIQLMRTQQAYVAATKLITTADQMMQTILNMVQ
jgi:flagellar hook-associated protein 1 FlgK